MKRLLIAAKKGDADSQFNLAVLYDRRMDDNGHAVGSSRTEAIKWLLEAARQGLPRAQGRLAELYADGRDLPGDHIRACAWFLLATASLGGIHRQGAQVGYEQVSALLTPAQVETASRLARRLRPKKRADFAAPGLPITHRR